MRARDAGFRSLRVGGWTIALPIAAAIGYVSWLLTDKISVSGMFGVAVSLFGLAILCIGYGLGGIWGGYWMIPFALAGIEIAWVCHIVGGNWVLALIAAGVFIVLMNFAAAIKRAAEDGAGVGRLWVHFFRGFVPGRYPR